MGQGQGWAKPVAVISAIVGALWIASEWHERSKRPPAKAPQQSVAERMAEYKRRNGPIPAKTIAIEGRQDHVLVIKIPYEDPLVPLELYRTCFVWRDAEFRTSVMQCDGQASMDDRNP